MSKLQSVAHQGRARRLHVLADLSQRGQASALTDRTLDKLLSYEAAVCRDQLRQIRTDLAEFEARFGQKSEAFFAQFQTGKTDDRLDYVEWASLFQMAQNLASRIQELADEGGS